jgi:hypothetical protein
MESLTPPPDASGAGFALIINKFIKAINNN